MPEPQPSPVGGDPRFPSQLREWPHSPVHRVAEAGTYMVTSGTYKKLLLFDNPERLHLLTNQLLALAERYGWRLQAWAVFPNHYHFLAESTRPVTLRKFVSHLHTRTASAVNRMDSLPARKVWFQYWETRITFQKSFLARLNYVHQNAVHHKLVRRASMYPWCSAAWFESKAEPAFFKVVSGFPCDKLMLPDDYDVTAHGSLMIDSCVQGDADA